MKVPSSNSICPLLVPVDMSCTVCTQGLALVDQDVKPAVIWYFPVSRLPEEIDHRFNALFKEKSKWTVDQITPYVM